MFSIKSMKWIKNKGEVGREPPLPSIVKVFLQLAWLQVKNVFLE